MRCKCPTLGEKTRFNTTKLIRHLKLWCPTEHSRQSQGFSFTPAPSPGAHRLCAASLSSDESVFSLLACCTVLVWYLQCSWTPTARFCFEFHRTPSYNRRTLIDWTEGRAVLPWKLFPVAAHEQALQSPGTRGRVITMFGWNHWFMRGPTTSCSREDIFLFNLSLHFHLMCCFCLKKSQPGSRPLNCLLTFRNLQVRRLAVTLLSDDWTSQLEIQYSQSVPLLGGTNICDLLKLC